jgi:hypothetical protein
MIARWFLFETRLGLFMLAVLERRAGLAVVSAEWLGKQSSGARVATGPAE